MWCCDLILQDPLDGCGEVPSFEGALKREPEPKTELTFAISPGSLVAIQDLMWRLITIGTARHRVDVTAGDGEEFSS